MKGARLIVNPAARGYRQFVAAETQIRALLESRGFAVTVVQTAAEAGSAARLGAAAAAAGAELVLACGGDGTVHGVVQGVARTGAALGMIPLGTANALARNLSLPLAPLAALERLLTYEAVSIPLGEMTVGSERRLFVVMAGCGPDGLLVQTLAQQAALKRRFGRAGYYGHAARLFLTRRWPVFGVDYRLRGSDKWARMEAVAMLAARVPDLGGVFRGLTRGAGLRDEGLQVQLLRPPGQVSLAAWVACGWSGVRNPWLKTLDVAEMRCTSIGRKAVYAQADAEPMGRLPVSLRMMPDGVKLLVPRSL